MELLGLGAVVVEAWVWRAVYACVRILSHEHAGVSGGDVPSLGGECYGVTGQGTTDAPEAGGRNVDHEGFRFRDAVGLVKWAKASEDGGGCWVGLELATELVGQFKQCGKLGVRLLLLAGSCHGGTSVNANFLNGLMRPYRLSVKRPGEVAFSL